MDNDFELQIKALLRSDNKIEAIKRYREHTGVGLAEAKSAIEAIERHGTLTPAAQPDEIDSSPAGDVTKQIITLIGNGQKIQAIKLYRETYRVDLRDAKESVERIGEDYGIANSSGSGCLGVLLLMVSAVVWTWAV